MKDRQQSHPGGSFVLGLTGGTGSGKSVLAGILKSCGAVVLDADAAGKQVVDECPDIQERIIALFGKSALDQNGVLDRKALGRQIFSRPESVQKMNRLVHPAMIRMLQKNISEYKKNPTGSLLVLDMALLFELGMENLCDYVVMVKAPRESRIRWLQKSRGWSRKETLGRMRNQSSDREKEKRADLVVKNTGSLEELKLRSNEIYRECIMRMGRDRREYASYQCNGEITKARRKRPTGEA